MNQLRVITSTVCRHFGVSDAEIYSRRRPQRIINARFAVYHLARKLTPFSYPEIGRFFDRDHATIVSGCRKADEMLANDPDFACRLKVCAADPFLTLEATRRIKNLAAESGFTVDLRRNHDRITENDGRFHSQTRPYKMPAYWSRQAASALREQKTAWLCGAWFEKSGSGAGNQGGNMIFLGKPCRKCGGLERYKDGKCRQCKIARQAAQRRANGVDIRSYKMAPGGWKEAWGTFEDDPRAPKWEPKFIPRHHGYVPSATVLDQVAV